MPRLLVIAGALALVQVPAHAQAPDSITVVWEQCGVASRTAAERRAPTYTSPVRRYGILDNTQRPAIDSLGQLLGVTSWAELRGEHGRLVCDARNPAGVRRLLLNLYIGTGNREVALTESMTSDVVRNASAFLRGAAKAWRPPRK